MGLQTKFVDSDNKVYESAYVRIAKIVTSNTDFEFFEPVDDPMQPDVAEKLSWVVKMNNTAYYYVYADKGVRDNRAAILTHGNIEFKYNTFAKANIYKQAYDALKQIFPDSIDV